MSKRVLMLSWCHLNSIHLMWFLAAAMTVANHFHFVFAVMAAVHQTTALNSMKIQHVLCIPSNDDYQLLGREQEKCFKILFYKKFFMPLAGFECMRKF